MFFLAERSLSSVGFFHTIDQYIIGNDSLNVFYFKVFCSGLTAYLFNHIQKVAKFNLIVDILISIMIQFNFLYFFLLIIGFLLY